MPKREAASMHNVWLIARREYVERIRTRGFLITTIMIPLIMGGFIFVSVFLDSSSESVAHIAVVSSDTQLALDLQTETLQQPQQSAHRAFRQATQHHRRTPWTSAPRVRRPRAPSSIGNWIPATSTATSGSRPRPHPPRQGPPVPPSPLPQDQANRTLCEARWPPPSAPSSCASSLPIAASPPPTPTPSSSPWTSSPLAPPTARTASPL